eukprot:33569_1
MAYKNDVDSDPELPKQSTLERPNSPELPTQNSPNRASTSTSSQKSRTSMETNVAVHLYDIEKQDGMDTNNDLEEVHFRLNEDIYTALVLLLTTRNIYQRSLRRSEQIVVIFMATVSFLVQFMSVILLFSYGDSIKTVDEVNITFTDTATSSDAILTQHHDPFHPETDLSANFYFFFIRIFALLGLVFYLGGLLSSTINTRIVAMNGRLWWMHGILICFQMYLLDIIVVSVVKIMVHSTVIEDVFSVSVGFFFLNEVDDWAYSMIKPHLSLFNQPGNDLFAFKIVRKVNRKWYENHAIWLLALFIWVVCALFIILFSYTYANEPLYYFSSALPTWGVALMTLIPPWIRHTQVADKKLKPFCQGIALVIFSLLLSFLNLFVQSIFADPRL